MAKYIDAPESTGQGIAELLSNLGNVYSEHKAEQKKTSQEQQQFKNKFQQAQMLGVGDEWLQLAIQSGPEQGSKMLDQFISEGKKSAKPETFLQNLGITSASGRSPYVSNQTPLFNQAKQNVGMGLPNIPGQQGNVANQLGIAKEQQLQQILSDPNTTAPQREAIRAEYQKAYEPKTWAETFQGLVPNLLSGAAQGVGSIREFMRPFHLGSPEQKNVLKGTLLGDEFEKDYEKYKELASPEAVKEKIVRPVAKKFNIERLITNPDAISTIAERVGKVATGTLLNGMLTGASPGKNILSNLITIAGSETAGELGKRISGPGADAAFTTLGYLTSGFRPGAFKNAISKGYNNFNKFIGNQPTKWLNGQPVVDQLQNMRSNLPIVSSKSARFINKKINDVLAKIYNVPMKLAKAGNLPSKALDARTAYKLDQSLGKDVFKEAQKLGPDTVRQLTEVRKSLRDIYQPYYSKINPNVTKGLINAREMEAGLHFKDATQKWLESVSKGNKGFFSRVLFALKSGVNTAAFARKWYKILENSPALQKQFHKILQEGAQKNKIGALNAITTFNKQAEKQGLS